MGPRRAAVSLGAVLLLAAATAHASRTEPLPGSRSLDEADPARDGNRDSADEGDPSAGSDSSPRPPSGSRPRPDGAPEPPSSDAPEPPPDAPHRERRPPEPRREPEPDLFDRSAMGRAVGWDLPERPFPSSREGRVDEHLGRYFHRHRVRDRIAAGLADGWYGRMSRQMRSRFRPDMERSREERRAGMTALQRAFDELRRYAKPPKAAGPGPDAPIDMQHELDESEQASLRTMEATNLLHAPVTWHRVDVRVTHSPEGQVQAAWVTRSSGNDTLDEAALDAVREAADLVSPPPERITEGRDAIFSEWAFEAGDVAPYVNQAGCVTGGPRGTQCAALGRGIVRTRVRLLHIEDATTPEEDVTN